MLKPVDQAFETIKGEITKSRDIAVENNNLKAHVSDIPLFHSPVLMAGCFQNS